MRQTLFLLLILTPCSISARNIENMKFIADQIGAIDLHIQAYQLFDRKCGMGFSLSERKLYEVNSLIKEKSGLSLKAFKEVIGISEESPFLWDVYTNVNGDTETCNDSAMLAWHRASQSHLEGAVERLRSADSVVQ
jgi:hypothetical protein